MKNALLILTAVCLCTAVQAQSIIGKWKTIDEKSGEPRSIVELYMKDGKVYGKVIKTFPKPDEDADPICDKCPDDLKDKKIIGMEIVVGLSKSGSTWKNGKILDPEVGTWYTCKIWLEGNDELRVRGYWGMFYRTQTWHRTE